MIKRTLAILVAMLALTLGRASAAAPAEHAAPAAADHSAAAPVAGEHDAHAGGHVEGDDRLVPIPPSRDTVVSAIWVILIFLIMLAILYRTAWKQVLAGLKKREGRIRQDIADAEAARKRAEETLGAYNKQLATAESQVRDLLAKAQVDAERIATTMKMQAQQDVEEIKERATRDIDAARKSALSDIYAQAAELSTNIAAKILGRNLNADDQRDLVEGSLQQFQRVGKN